MVLLLMLVLLCSTVNAASTPYEIQPRFTSIMQFDSQVTISADGYAECCTEVRLSDSSYTAALTMELQRSSNGRFGDTVKSWNTSAEGFASMAKGRFVSSGYKYRVYASVEVTAPDGTVVETVPTYSLTSEY